MKHAREDYNRIQDPAGLIPENEPVFLFRAQDRLATKALEAYAHALEEEANSIAIGFDEIKEAAVNDLLTMSELTWKQIRAFRQWHTHKTPDYQLKLFEE